MRDIPRPTVVTRACLILWLAAAAGLVYSLATLSIYHDLSSLQPITTIATNEAPPLLETDLDEALWYFNASIWWGAILALAIAPLTLLLWRRVLKARRWLISVAVLLLISGMVFVVSEAASGEIVKLLSAVYDDGSLPGRGQFITTFTSLSVAYFGLFIGILMNLSPFVVNWLNKPNQAGAERSWQLSESGNR